MTESNGKVLALADRPVTEEKTSWAAVVYEGKGTSQPRIAVDNIDPLKVLVGIELFQNRRIPLRGITNAAPQFEGRTHFILAGEGIDQPISHAARYECSDEQAHAAIIFLKLWAEQVLMLSVFAAPEPKKGLAVPKHFRGK